MHLSLSSDMEVDIAVQESVGTVLPSTCVYMHIAPVSKGPGCTVWLPEHGSVVQEEGGKG